MSVVATLLYGSQARADHAVGSDTDLLMISLNEERRHVAIGQLSLFLYPWSQLAQEALDGDLFVCHITREAKPLIDPENFLPRLQRIFRFRASYALEITNAGDFGWFLVKYGLELNPLLLMKRALWCVRTILIAKSAEQRDPVFAPERLAERTNSLSGQYLLLHRRSSLDVQTIQNALQQFLIDEGIDDVSWIHATRLDRIQRFKVTANRVALQTLKQRPASPSGYSD